MENPQGGLEFQLYILAWERAHMGVVVKKTVDYCAYRHPYMKPTNIWTSKTWWVPQGIANTAGRCQGVCEGGSIGEHNRWVHEYAIGQQSWQMMAGRGRTAMKAAVPVLLHAEVMGARPVADQ